MQARGNTIIGNKMSNRMLSKSKPIITCLSQDHRKACNGGFGREAKRIGGVGEKVKGSGIVGEDNDDSPSPLEIRSRDKL
jgi:hypothetical protein